MGLQRVGHDFPRSELCMTSRDADRENRLVDVEGKKVGHIERVALTCVHCRVPSLQLVGSCCVDPGAQPCPLTAWSGGVGREPPQGGRVLLPDSRCCMAETLLAQTVKNLPAMREKRKATPSSILAWRLPMDRGAWRATVHGVAQSQTRLSD